MIMSMIMYTGMFKFSSISIRSSILLNRRMSAPLFNFLLVYMAFSAFVLNIFINASFVNAFHNSFQASFRFLYLPKASENQRFSNIFRRYSNDTLAWVGLWKQSMITSSFGCQYNSSNVVLYFHISISPFKLTRKMYEKS